MAKQLRIVLDNKYTGTFAEVKKLRLRIFKKYSSVGQFFPSNVAQ